MDAPAPDWDAARILAHLGAHASAEDRAGMARFGINTARAFGIGNAALRPLGRALGRDHARALALWRSGWREARLLACFTAEPGRVTAAQARGWAGDLDSWEVTDHAAALFVKAGLAEALVPEFAADARLFVRRAGFAMMAWGAVHIAARPDAAAPDRLFLDWLRIVEATALAGDARPYVRKAVDWALRQIGKRSERLHGPALALARRLAAAPDRTARRIGRTAMRELEADTTRARLAARARRAAGRAAR